MLNNTCGHNEALSPYTRDRSEAGPTDTFTYQRVFAQRLRGILGRINARIREAIIGNNAFQKTEALVDDPPDSIFQTDNSRAAVGRFLEWVRTQLDNDYLEVVGPDRNQFIRAAYAAGIRNAQQQISDLDVSFERADVDELLGRPIHRSSLQELYTRTYENLQSVRDDVAQAVRDELVEGFAEGENPTKIARRLTDRINSIGKHRSTMIARSEVMNAHSTGTLNRIDEINQDRPEREDELVTGHGQWNAAIGQPNTCAFCRTLNGTDLTTSEMATTTVQFRGQTYRLKPPAHPMGRCGISVRVGPNQLDTPLEERLPAEITLLT